MHKHSQQKIMYNTLTGPYLITTFISLSPSINPLSTINTIVASTSNTNLSTNSELPNYTHNGIPYFHKPTSRNYLLISTASHTNIELLYSIRSSDCVIFLIDNNAITTGLTFYKKHLPAYLFCYMNKDEKQSAVKYADKYFSCENVVYIGNLFNKLVNVKDDCAYVRIFRPCFVPAKYLLEGRYLYADGFMRKGFTSRNFMINGMYKCKIVGITVGDNEVDTEFIDENINLVDFYKNKDTNDEFDNIDENVECDEDEMSEESDDNCLIYEENREDMIEKYKEYRGIKNMQTCEFVTRKYPEYYNDVFIFDQFKHLEAKIKKIKSKIEENQMITVKFLLEDDLNVNFISMFNYYDFEDIKTIYNVEFTCAKDSSLVTNEQYIIDLGWRFININPMLTNNSSAKVHKAIMTSQSGILSFIAPLSFHTTKIIIYKNLISPEAFIGLGQNIIYNDRVILEEAIIKGLPHKIDKRYCTVRNMFMTKDEVLYFRNIELRTRSKVLGIIKKPIGTHGVFKAYFQKPISHGDYIMLQLYKRIFLSDYGH